MGRAHLVELSRTLQQERVQKKADKKRICSSSIAFSMCPLGEKNLGGRVALDRARLFELSRSLQQEAQEKADKKADEKQ